MKLLLFKHEHILEIKAGRKTQTRRIWKRCRVKIGTVHQVKETLFGRPETTVKILEVNFGPLLDITEQDAYAEGGYTREQYLTKWREINPHSPPNPNVYAIRFEEVPMIAEPSHHSDLEMSKKNGFELTGRLGAE